jgi:hypothetical protein
MSRAAMIRQVRPAGGLPLVGLMLAVTVLVLGTASQRVERSAVPGVDAAALPAAIVGLGDLPLPPR